MFDRGWLVSLVAVWIVGIPAVATAAPIRVAMLPVVVHAASGESGYLSEGLAVMLAARLEQAGGIQVIRLQSNDRATANVDVAVEAGKAADADFVVFGSFTQFGSGASLDVRCARVDGGGDGDLSARQVFIQSGDLGAIIPKLDDLSGRIVRYLKDGAEVPTAARPAPADASLEDLSRRVEKLERKVFEVESPGDAAPVAGAQ